MDPKSKTAILLLAAGSSSRLGQPKQLVPLQGRPLLQNIARIALSSGCDPVVVVLGAYFEKIKPVLKDLPVVVVENKNWATGMGSSIACGMQFLTTHQPDLEAVLVLVCDQYRLSVQTIDNLLRLYESSRSKIVASKYEETIGVPALFHRTYFPALLQLEGQQGARKIMRENSSDVATVSFADGAFDLDTTRDLEQLP